MISAIQAHLGSARTVSRGDWAQSITAQIASTTGISSKSTRPICSAYAASADLTSHELSENPVAMAARWL